MSVAVALLITSASGMRIDWAEAGWKCALFAGVLLGSTRLNSRWGRTFAGDCLAPQAIIGLSGVACGFTILTGLHLHFPRVDHGLMVLDRAIGLDGVAFVTLVTRLPKAAQGVLVIAYKLTVPLIPFSILVQALRGRRLEAWRASFCFAGSLLTVALVSILTPAKGIGLWISDETLARLPAASMRSFWFTFDRFYDGGEVVLRTTSIDGVVSFPSFHIVMGLIVVMLWRKKPLTLALAVAWFVPMLIATVPLGGHYFVDLVGGLAIWLAWLWLSQRLAESAPPTLARSESGAARGRLPRAAA